MAGLKDGISGGGGGADYTTGTFSGNMTLGDASGDTITVTGTATFAESATFTSGLTSNGAITLGAGDDLIGSATSDITINTNKFTVAGASGDTVIAGTCGVTGLLTCTAGLSVGTTVTLAGDGDVLDSNGNELLSFVATGSAVNEFTFTNAATGNGIDLSATGGDANIDIVLSPKGSGAVSVSGGLILSEITTSSGAGAVAITGGLHEVTTTGTGDALTLANGTAGQRLCVVYVAEAAGGDTAVITPTTLAGGSTITLNALGDSCDLVYSSTGGWYVLGLGGTAAVA